MTKRNQAQFSGQLGSWIYKRLNKFESNLLLFILIGIIMKYYTSTNVGLILTASFGLLSLIYFLTALYTPGSIKNHSLLRILHKLAFLAASITVNGTLFIVQAWPSMESMVMIGSTGLLISTSIIFLLNKQKGPFHVFDQRYFLRLAVLAVVGVAAFIFI